MAASDKPFHNQRTLDIVFAVSSILMLLSVGWMLGQDYSREWKVSQRLFREIEVAIAQRQSLGAIPTEEEFAAAENKVKTLKAAREARATDLAAAQSAIISLRPAKEKAEAAFQAAKSDVESITSFRNIALEQKDTKLADKHDKDLVALNAKLAEVQSNRDEIVSKMRAEQLKIDDIEGSLTKAVAEFKKVSDRFDAQVKLALNKRWGWGDWFRTLPVIDGFANPLRIHQFTINDIPIDYNFKQVTRFDRCMSCHQGIDRPAFTRANLEALWTEDPAKEKLDDALKFYKRRIDALDPKDQAVIPNPNDLRLATISKDVLTPARITEFCAHPRLELFVGSNSKHPAEKFGCTSCHSGQGSGTSFVDASHSPDSMDAQKKWSKDRGWEFNHMWDFPMLPTRFIESSCLKCHHEVTDLVGRDNKSEAPKLLRGHTLIKENGCFGCHEISGWKGGARVGPDLRLEPSTPLEDMLPEERTRVENDPDNRPGGLRKVGPSLARVSEKVSGEWIKKWLRSPSSFRPDTKMPHYYGLSTNDKSVLPADQKNFPDTEMDAIAHFLTVTSDKYKSDAKKVADEDATKRSEDKARLQALLTKGRLDEKEQTEFALIKERIKLRKENDALKRVLADSAEGLAKEYKADAGKGRILFTEKGCLACHTHQGTETKSATLPEIASDAVFGPNLRQIGDKFTDKSAGRKWLVPWILNPQVHNPRTRMPVTHLTSKEAADIAEWLLDQKYARDENDPWVKGAVERPERKDLENLARVYLVRMLSKNDTERFLKGEFKDGTDWDIIKGDLPKDEQVLKDKVGNDNELKFYLGKKAVTRLGCFGCHDIPGFETTKSIGVALNDWGKKPADRLAFEDIHNFFDKHYQTDDPHNMKDGKEPYEPFYAEALNGHHKRREGYLNQKIRDPRSYDYNRIRAWDDRARMPQFTLARPRKKADEKDEAFKGRIFKEEAAAREAVATFVLGLVAEQVPTKSVNQPTGDRLAEIKGRQVLDKYNCAGCHTIRPGVYDFKLSEKMLGDGKNKAGLLDEKHASILKLMNDVGETPFLNHHNWVGRNPLGGDRATAFGVQASFQEDEVLIYLSEAFRFVGKKDKAVKNIPAGAVLRIPLEDLVAKPESVKSQADFDRQFQAVAPYGGTFADLAMTWLSKKDPKKYPMVGGNSAEARAALPPSLVGQGERTQPAWLKAFLLNPRAVRPMTILRMPKFNMSEDEAQILVDYFAAVSRQNNPGIGLTPANPLIPAQIDLASDYWRTRTADYVKRLHDLKDKNGKELFDSRIAEYEKIFDKVRLNAEPPTKARIKELDEIIDKTKNEKLAKEKAFMAEQNEVEKAKLQKEIGDLTSLLESATYKQKAEQQGLDKLGVKEQRRVWESEEAYAADAYRLLTSRTLCSKCHQIGNIKPAELDKQGPPLDLASERLRPEWIERWVTQPQRFVAYPSLMPAYFNANPAKIDFQHLHAGPAPDQIQALRDALMNYPRLSRLPVNRVHDPDLSAVK